MQTGHTRWFAQSTVAGNLQGSEQLLADTDPVTDIGAEVESVLAGLQRERPPPDAISDIKGTPSPPSFLVMLRGNRFFESVPDPAEGDLNRHLDQRQAVAPAGRRQQ